MLRGEERTSWNAASGQGAAGLQVQAVLGLEEQVLLTAGGWRHARGVASREKGWAPTAVILPWDGAMDGP